MNTFFDTNIKELTTVDNKSNKWLIGYDTTLDDQAKFNLSKFVTTDADGFISTQDNALIKILRASFSEYAEFNSKAVFKTAISHFSENVEVIQENNDETFCFSIRKHDDPSQQTQAITVNLNTSNVDIAKELHVKGKIATPNVCLNRYNTLQKGGELSFARPIDNKEFWHNDCFGINEFPVLRWFHSGSVKLNLDPNGTLTASGDLAAFSDVKSKTNIKTIENALSKVINMRGVEFEKLDDDTKHIGVIAQEIESVLPQVVREVNGLKTVAYGNIVGVLIEAIKDLSKQLNELKAAI